MQHYIETNALQAQGDEWTGLLYRREFIAVLLSGAVGATVLAKTGGSYDSNQLRPAMFARRDSSGRSWEKVT